MQMLGQEAILTKAAKTMNKSFPKTILIAEDDEASRIFLRLFLVEEGFNVIEAKNGAEAVSLARQENPDLILTDLHMPELDGIGAVRQIRSDEKLRDIPILAMSGDGRRGMELFLNMDDLGTGYINYLTKPLSMSAVIEQINMLLPSHRFTFAP